MQHAFDSVMRRYVKYVQYNYNKINIYCAGNYGNVQCVKCGRHATNPHEKAFIQSQNLNIDLGIN